MALKIERYRTWDIFFEKGLFFGLRHGQKTISKKKLNSIKRIIDEKRFRELSKKKFAKRRKGAIV